MGGYRGMGRAALSVPPRPARVRRRLSAAYARLATRFASAARSRFNAAGLSTSSRAAVSAQPGTQGLCVLHRGFEQHGWDLSLCTRDGNAAGALAGVLRRVPEVVARLVKDKARPGRCRQAISFMHSYRRTIYLELDRPLWSTTGR